MPRQRQNSFTLIEMLAVLTILAIILGIGILSVTKIGRSMKLQMAGSDLVNTLNQARQYAILHRTQTSVIFSVNPSADGTNIAPPFTSYAVSTGTVYNRGTISYAQPFSIGYVTRWKQLPQGIVFDCSSWQGPGTTYYPESFRFASRGVGNCFGPIVAQVNFPTNGGANAAEGFMQLGYDSYLASSITLREGYYDPSKAGINQRVYTQLGGLGGQLADVTNANNYFNIQIRSPFGSVGVKRK